ncbi:MAG TPA: isochorismatase family cysteine hydrolase [Steroidobacter sp.]
MPRKRAKSALLILDMISDFRFPDGERIVRSAQRVSVNISRLKERAHAHGTPVIYVNDTGGKWESDQRAFIRRCLQPTAKGRRVVEALAPSDQDYFMFKPRHSAFFGTPLETLLRRLRVGRLVVTGTTSHQCVLFTAMDAHVREYELAIPSDCISAPSIADTRHALYILSRALNADIGRARSIRW